MDTVFFLSASVGLTYEQYAVKLVVRLLKSGMNGKGLLSMGFQYLSCITHAQLSKAAKRIECVINLRSGSIFVSLGQTFRREGRNEK